MNLVFANSPPVRFVTGAMMYFAQGVPQGLLVISLPAWLASEGVGASAIGSYLAVIVLPWAFKLLAGPLMDRYQYLPMGRRRPWVLAAQFGLTLSLLGLMLIDDPAGQLGLLMLLGVLINSFAAVQDSAIDGMAIDLTPVREQGRLNAYMSFGKAVGWSVTSAVTGVLLVTYGMSATAIACAAACGAILLAMALVLEHEGERRWPWSTGTAGCEHRPGNSFRAVFGGLKEVLCTWASVVVMGIVFFHEVVVGYGQALMPIAAINVFGLTTPQWAQLVAAMGLVGAGAALGLGPLVDRFGAKRITLLAAGLLALHAFILAQTQHLWADTLYVRVMLSLWVLMIPVTLVCVVALAMAVCNSTISATQFAVYMSIANLGHAVGAKVYGMVAERTSYAQNYALLCAFAIVVLAVLLLHRHSVEDDPPAEPGERRRHYTVALSGAEGGIFLSGAMRCPKCHADMEPVNHEGIEIDRCRICSGVWFDAGEVELLRNASAAAAIDIGDAAAGKKHNKTDDYPCPRCSGAMVKLVDPQQRHIWYETCDSCDGSFFDAGEFRDLAEHTISDFFKRLTVAGRG